MEIAEALEAGIDVKDICWIRGTCYRDSKIDLDEDTVRLPDYDQITASKDMYCRSFATAYKNSDPISGKRLVEKYADTVYVIQNPPQPPLEREELDDVYELPYENEAHPMYVGQGDIPAFREVKFSLVSSRGCFGGCSFCALTYHQGRQVRSRSRESLVREDQAPDGKKGLQGIYPRCGRPYGKFSGSCLQKTAEERRMQEQRLSISPSVQ